MTEQYKNPIKKDKRKVRKRSRNPRSALDFFTNFLIDYKNLIRRIKAEQKSLEKMEYEVYQMYDAMKQIMRFVKKKRLQDIDIVKELRDDLDS